VSRFLCWILGHIPRVVVLPEDPFGLYRYSQIECSRCGVTLEEGLSLADQIDTLMGYVTLWNDVRPIVDGAREYLAHDGSGIREKGRWAGDFDVMHLFDARLALRSAIERYETLYPEHARGV